MCVSVKMMSSAFLLSLILSIAAAQDRGDLGDPGQARMCNVCLKEECSPPVDCLAGKMCLPSLCLPFLTGSSGIVPDHCGCCLVCARSEGQLCDEDVAQASARRTTRAASATIDGYFGVCGDNLECVKSADTVTSLNGENGLIIPPKGEHVCQCRVSKMVCGSDDVTYETICRLNEEATRRGKPDKYNPQLTIQYWGPCNEAPTIISPPKDSYGPLGANLTLDCEAKGYPAPEISWMFLSAKGETIMLPSKATMGSLMTLATFPL